MLSKNFNYVIEEYFYKVNSFVLTFYKIYKHFQLNLKFF